MKNKLILLLLMPVFCSAGNIGCKDVHEGIFKLYGLYGSLNTIVRTHDKQTESFGRSATVFEYDVQWTSECTYLLLNRRAIKGSDSIKAIVNSDTIYNEIVEANNYWHKIVSTVNGCDPKTTISFFNVDTTRSYRDLNDLSLFKDHTGPTTGASFIGYNYAVMYKQERAEANNFTIDFLEALVINSKSRYRLLDNIQCTIDSNQHIATTSCRFDDKYDKEIVAIYSSSSPKKEASIIKAWRFNKLKMKIEEVSVDQVKYKVADKMKPVWYDIEPLPDSLLKLDTEPDSIPEPVENFWDFK